MSNKENKIQPFHLAIPVNNLPKAQNFYHDLLGCEMGRSSDKWIDFNFYGHQLVCHLSDESSSEISNSVDSEEIPVPHFGLVLDWDDFHTVTNVPDIRTLATTRGKSSTKVPKKCPRICPRFYRL